MHNSTSSPEKAKSLTAIAATAAKGFSMGLADIVPGVSGGTVALVFNIYDQLLNNLRSGVRSLRSLAKFDFSSFATQLGSLQWSFLLPLAGGLLTALALMSGVIETLLHNNPEEMAGLFLGLVAGSIAIAWTMFDQRGHSELTLMLAIGAITFLLLGFQSAPSADPPLLGFFGAGCLAICAMILPGISGAFILLMLGMYAPVLGAAHDKDLVPIVVFAVGCAIGLGLFSTILGWFLDHHRDRLLAALIGLMIGSVRVLWPWPHGVGIISDVESESVTGTGLDWPSSMQAGIGPTALGVMGLAIVLGVSALAPHKPEPQD